MSVSLQKKLSIRVPLVSVNLVGRVILLKIGLWFIFNRSIFRSPVIIISELDLSKHDNNLANSSINVL